MQSEGHYNSHEADRRALLLEELVALFRRAGWRVVREPKDELRADLLIERKRRRYVVEVKIGTEARRDRLVPLLSQAILQAQASARRGGSRARPLAIVASHHVPPALVDSLISFAKHVAPDVAVGIIDRNGGRHFSVPELQELDAAPAVNRLPQDAAVPAPRLFSDLNQWMLKLLLAPRVPEKFLAAPRAHYRNASELAKAAGASVMSAFRFVSLLRSELFLAETAEPLQLVRVDELLRRWAAANHGPWRDVPTRWIAGEGAHSLDKAVRKYVMRQEADLAKRKAHGRPLPRLCLGLFSAARALDLAIVHGAPQHLYIEEISEDALRVLGLRSARDRVDVYLRVPRAPESVFRAAVHNEALVVADALQIWLDLLEHPARGAAQAEEIKRRTLANLFESGERS